METIERIDELKSELREQEEFIRSEELKIVRMQENCHKVAELLSEYSMKLAENLMFRVAKKMKKQQPDVIEPDDKEKLEEEFDVLLRGLPRRSKDLTADRDIWPHIICRIQVNLDERLRKAQFELKGIENKMLDGTRAQLRKRALQMEETKNLCNRMEKAVLSIESWEKLYLMFMQDMEIRRQSGMDDTFYKLEREDIRRKLHTCFEFTDIICKELEEKLETSVRDCVNGLGYLLVDYGFRFPKELWNRSRTKIEYREPIVFSEEILEEITRYSAGIMFIEKHIHNLGIADDKCKQIQIELERLHRELGDDHKLVV